MTADTTLLQPARLLDFTAGPFLNLIDGRGWRDLDERDRIGASYGFVRDEIHFGYNRGATSRRPLDCHVVLTEDGWTASGR